MAGRGALQRFRDRVRGSIRGTDAGEIAARGDRDPPAGAAGEPAAPAVPTSERGIVVSYAPERDGEADPGEVVWSWVPYEDDPSQGKDRPVLILGWDGPALVGIPLSSKDHAQRRDAGEWVEVGRGGWDADARVSYADASRLLRMAPADVRREGAALDEARFRQVLERVERLHDWQA